MTGPVTVVIDSDWVPPVDFVLEMDGSTSPASIYAGTTWTQLKNCIIFAAGSTFRAEEQAYHSQQAICQVTTIVCQFRPWVIISIQQLHLHEAAALVLVQVIMTLREQLELQATLLVPEEAMDTH